MFTLENIDDITMFDHAYFREDHHYTIKILQSIGLLHEYRKCACGEIMYLYKRKDTGDGVQFKCYNCSERYDLLCELDIGSFTSISEWKTIIRYFMASKLDEDFSKIGGPGKIVQIDETAICKNKYNIGRILKNQHFRWEASMRMEIVF